MPDINCPSYLIPTKFYAVSPTSAPNQLKRLQAGQFITSPAHPGRPISADSPLQFNAFEGIHKQSSIRTLREYLTGTEPHIGISRYAATNMLTRHMHGVYLPESVSLISVAKSIPWTTTSLSLSMKGVEDALSAPEAACLHGNGGQGRSAARWSWTYSRCFEEQETGDTTGAAVYLRLPAPEMLRYYNIRNRHTKEALWSTRPLVYGIGGEEGSLPGLRGDNIEMD
ncbi:uncharacterized protein DSM5745_00947 [Aspergillus mulundensis]|uniref:Uncharacterized protein n=1 Tax=Aspergillus mulundensis TaxID=1810919 RepID=A0A3D8T4Y8_9EURO|nr:hypothetical protein DSM5745_00947 [Aspergillus mulundensis]RDW93625.1 hypothetical protein DSM5745_00947 [Aspergillus mulundensis]